MNRKTAILTTTFAVLAMSSCSTIRQLHLAPEDNESTPTPTTVYVVDIGTPAYPTIPVVDPCLAGAVVCEPNVAAAAVNDPPCDLAGFPSPCQTPATTEPGPAVGFCADGQKVETGCPRN